jgi:hypothetical protein
MLSLLILFIAFLTTVFFLSRSLSKNLFFFFYLLTKDNETSINLLTWLFLPGTIIHELSHLLTAELLGVRTGELSFRPEIRENNEIRLGGLKMAKTDPLRHSLIGLAPTLVGMTMIASLVHFVFIPLAQKTFSFSFSPANYQLLFTNYSLLFTLCYLIFILSNTMFSSKKDLETILFPLLLLTLLGTVIWLGKFRISFPPKIISLVTNLLKKFDWALLATAIIDLVFLSFIKLSLRRSKLA